MMKKYLLALLGLGAITCTQEPQKKAIVVKQSVEDIITKYAAIEKIVNKEGQGNLYLIGMQHWYAGTTEDGVDQNAEQEEALAYVQAEIYLTLHGLTKHGLRLVIGEGLGPNELKLDPNAKGLSREYVTYYRKMMLDKNFAVDFFKQNPKEPSYAALELLNPDLVVTYGADDRKEMAELKSIDRAIFNLALKYIPTRKDYENPVKRRQMRNAERPLLRRKKELNDERSRIYLKDALKRAADQDLAIVIGAQHVQLMVDEYKGTRKLYVIKPASLTHTLLKK